MKILYIISGPAAGGAEIYVKDLAKAILAKGHSVMIGFVGPARDIGRSLEFEQQFLAELDEHNIEYFFVGNECRRNLLLGRQRVKKEIVSRGIDLYHSHLFYGGLWGAFLSIPRVYTHHSSEPRAGKPFFWVYSHFVDQYVGISKACSVALSDHTGRRVELIENGVDKTKLEQCQEPKTEGDARFRFIAIGRLTVKKDYPTMIKAIAMLPDQARRSIHVSICGEGPDEPELVHLLDSHGLHDVVSLLGNRDDIPALLGNSHAFLMSSSSEGLPIAFIEATLSGLPCIVTDVGGISEVISRCQNGVLIPPQSPNELSSAIQEFVIDSERRAKYRLNAIEFGDYYTIERACDAHLSLYERMITGR